LFSDQGFFLSHIAFFFRSHSSSGRICLPIKPSFFSDQAFFFFRPSLLPLTRGIPLQTAFLFPPSLLSLTGGFPLQTKLSFSSDRIPLPTKPSSSSDHILLPTAFFFRPHLFSDQGFFLSHLAFFFRPHSSSDRIHLPTAFVFRSSLLSLTRGIPLQIAFLF
jgi:hypothetical protein